MLKTIIQYILDLGPSVFLPILMIIIGLIVRMKPSKAISAALTLGVAFAGMSVILNFMFDQISPAAQAFVKATG
ncbi:PTS transporter subunit IIC [Thermoanaerobacter thermocopriae]|nr:PTS transporter subunit IIC [Thermoanaerobacter thermocopriae]